MTTTVAVPPIRRWIRRTQAAHRDRRETLGNFYFAVFAVLVLGGILYNQLRAIFWPTAATASALAGASLVLVVAGALHLALRRLGPLALSRPAASWLLTAPVHRGHLLRAPMRLAALGAAVAGALGAYAVVGHAGPRPLTGAAAWVVPVGGAMLGALVFLLAEFAQHRRWWAALLDRAAMLAASAGLAGLVVDAARGAPRLNAGWPADQVLIGVVGGLAVVLVLGFSLAVRRIGSTSNERLLDASRTAGTLADSAFGVEPSFVVEMIERRYWACRRLRSARLNTRVPVLVAQDLRQASRRPARLILLTGATALPALLEPAPRWQMGLAVLAGAWLAAATTTSSVRGDAVNPVLLRLLGLSSRQSVIQRLAVPTTLALLWATVSFTVLQVLGMLPAGPWWLLGVTVAPVCAMAAVRRARVGFVDNGLLPLDTPMGTVSTGPLLNAIIGFDSLLFAIPALIAVGTGSPLTWTMLLVQAAVTALGLRLYLNLTTANDRVELAEAR